MSIGEKIFPGFYNACLAKTLTVLDKPGALYKISVFATILSLFLAFPRESLWTGQIEPNLVKTHQALDAKIAEPLAVHDVSPESHEGKFVFRLSVPVLAKCLGLGSAGTVWIGFTCAVLLFPLSFLLFRRITDDPVSAVWLTFGIAAIFPGHTGFIELVGMFDGFAMLFLVAAMYFRYPILIFLSVFLASWADERGLIASSFVWLFHFLELRKERNFLETIFQFRLVIVYIAWASYFAIRWFLSQVYGMSTPSDGTGISVLVAQISNIPLGLWSSIEAFWFLVFWVNLLVYLMKDWIVLVFMNTFSVVVLGVGFMVYDITRSTAYFFPMIFAAVLLLFRHEGRTELKRKIIFSVMLLSVLWPSLYAFGKGGVWWHAPPLPVQAIRMVFF